MSLFAVSTTRSFDTILGNSRRGLIGIATLVTTAIHCRGHIVVRGATLHCRVCVAQPAHQ